MTRARLCSIMVMGAGFAFLALTGFFYLGSCRSLPGLIVEEPHRVLTDLPPGATQDVEFCIQNRSDGPLRIVGTSAL